jgi:hypothetical protein
VQTVQQAQGQVAPSNQVAGQNYGTAIAFPGGGAGGYANTPLPTAFVQSGIPEGTNRGFVAPVQPTVAMPGFVAPNSLVLA